MVHVVVHRERHARVGAVYRAGRRKDEVLHPAVAAAFQDVGEADDVGVDVGVRVLQRIAHAGLGGQVDDDVETLVLEEPLHALPVGQVEPGELEAGPPLELRQAVLLQLDAVVGVQVVETDHPRAAVQQALGEMKADEPGRTGDQYVGVGNH